MEWLYALGELAFPWLTIGNTQTYQLEKIQIADITGVYGLSLWLLIINVLVYFLVRVIQSGSKDNRRFYLASAIIILYMMPNLYSPDKDQFRNTEGRSINVGIVQPNIDPWSKWEGPNTFTSRWRQVQHYLELIGKNINQNTDLVVLPDRLVQRQRERPTIAAVWQVVAGRRTHDLVACDLPAWDAAVEAVLVGDGLAAAVGAGGEGHDAIRSAALTACSSRQVEQQNAGIWYRQPGR